MPTANTAGDMRFRVTVQKDTGTTVDASGQPIANWVTDQTRWAAVTTESGQEFQPASNEAYAGETTFVVRMRYYAGLTTANRILLYTRVLSIESVVNQDERKIWTVCKCREVI